MEYITLEISEALLNAQVNTREFYLNSFFNKQSSSESVVRVNLYH